MKAFQAWFTNRLEQSGKLSAHEVWKAALEWTLTQRMSGIEEDGSISTSDLIPVRRIQEELNNE